MGARQPQIELNIRRMHTSLDGFCDGSGDGSDDDDRQSNDFVDRRTLHFERDYGLGSWA